MLKRVTSSGRPLVLRTIAYASRDRFAGEDLQALRPPVCTLRQRGYDVALAYWNRDDEPAAAVSAAYHQALRGAAAIGGYSYISIKAPAFGFDASVFDSLLAVANGLGVPLHLDSMGIEAADRTFALVLDHQLPPHRGIGCTLPGRWRRSRGDAETLKDTDVAVRIVKGEWPDPAAPHSDGTQGFLSVARMLAGRAAPVRIATHDTDLAWRSIDLLRRGGTPCELEVLYGFPVRATLPRLLEMGLPIRAYVPFGHGWAGYCLEYMRARPSFFWWLAADYLHGRYLDGFPRATQTATLTTRPPHLPRQPIEGP